MVLTKSLSRTVTAISSPLRSQLMDDEVKSATLKEFRRIPGVGKSIAVDLWNLGLREVTELKNQDPEELIRGSVFSREHMWTAVCFTSCAVPSIMPLPQTPNQRSCNGGTG